MRLILQALTSVDQRLSTATLVEMTGAAAGSTVLVSARKLLNNGIITTGTIDGITHYEVSDPTMAVAR
jgi:hypothetical protein